MADWRHRQNIYGEQAHVGSGKKRERGDEKDRRIRELEKENAELARANEILQEALGFSQRTERSKGTLAVMQLKKENEQLRRFVNGIPPELRQALKEQQRGRRKDFQR